MFVYLIAMLRFQIQNPMPLDPRTEFHRVIIRSSRSTTKATPGCQKPDMTELILKAFSTGGQRSSRAASLCSANGLVILPPLVAEADGKSRMEVGEFVQAMVIGEIEEYSAGAI